MSKFPYTYAVLRYVHDPVSEESLNVGVVVFCPETGYLRAKIQHEYGRLSSAFCNFKGDYYRQVTRHIENRLNCYKDHLECMLPFDASSPSDARVIANSVLPDDDSALRMSNVRGGLTADAELSLDELYNRYVMLYHPQQKREVRSEEDVWRTFRTNLARENVLTKLQSVTLSGGSFEHSFDNAWKNSNWHPLEAISMDAISGDTLRERAVRWAGRAMDLSATKDLGTLYFLIGPPNRDGLKVQYGKALDLLHKVPVQHEIILENEASSFASSFSSLIKEHEEYV